MRTRPELEEIEDWLIREALGSPDISALFAGTCERLRSLGIPIVRANLAWATLHPLVDAEAVLWTLDEGARFEQYRHEHGEGAEWLDSPIRALIVSGEGEEGIEIKCPLRSWTLEHQHEAQMLLQLHR